MANAVTAVTVAAVATEGGAVAAEAVVETPAEAAETAVQATTVLLLADSSRQQTGVAAGVVEVTGVAVTEAVATVAAIDPAVTEVTEMAAEVAAEVAVVVAVVATEVNSSSACAAAVAKAAVDAVDMPRENRRGRSSELCQLAVGLRLPSLLGLTSYRYDNDRPPQPDEGIRQLENTLMATSTAPAARPAAVPAKGAGRGGARGGKKAQAGPSAGASLDVSRFRFPHRPAYGRDGKPIQVWANYFELSVRNMPPVFLYTFHAFKKQPAQSEEPEASRPSSAPAPTAAPAGRGAEMKGPFLRKLLKQVLDTVLNDPALAARTEFLSKLITLQPIPADRISALRDTQFDGGHFAIELDGPQTLDVTGLHSWLTTMHDERDATDAHFPKFQDLVDAIGIIIGHGPRMGGGGAGAADDTPRTVAVGRGRYFPIDEIREAEPMPWSRPLEILRGYFQSVRPATGRLLLNVNVTHGVFRSSRGLPFADLFRDCHFRDLEQTLKGARVRVTYPDGTAKDYTVSGFAIKPGGHGGSRTESTGEAKFKKIGDVTFALDGSETKSRKKKKGGDGGNSSAETTVLAYLKDSELSQISAGFRKLIITNVL